MKIDLVYLWVDGSDPKWKASKNAALKAVGRATMPDDAVRWFDNDELRFSLRSVQKFAPWINHIFIITDAQVPKWLDTKNPKITIVDHTEIIPREALPTFNTNVIEFCIKNIRALGEYFIIANDDTFFGRRTGPGYFFTKDGAPIIQGRRYAMKKLAARSPVLYRSKKLIRKIYGDTHSYGWVPGHNMDPYRKSCIQRMSAHPMIEPEIKKAILNKFRTADDLQRIMFHEWMLASKTAVPRTFKRAAWVILRILGAVPVYASHARKIDMMWIKPKLFCINDSGADSHTDQASRAFFEKMFPEKSEFEK